MKKYILAAALLASSTSFSQGILINMTGDPTDISGTTYIETITGIAENHHIVDFLVQNTTAIDQAWMVTRRIIEQPPLLWTNSFCWGVLGVSGFCYSSQAEYSPSALLDVPAGGAGTLNTYLDSAFISGTALYRYYISLDGINYLDSVDIRINSSLGTNDLESTLNVLVSPNPASDKITIATQGTTNGVAKIIDVLGNVIITTTFNGTNTIDVSELKDGIYFVLVESEGLKPSSQRIVIQK